MPSHTEQQREEYYKVLERFKAFCDARGGRSWLVILHRFMLATMGEKASFPRAHMGVEDGPAGRRRGQVRIDWKHGTFLRLTDQQTFHGIDGAAGAARVGYQSFREAILRGRPIRGHVWVREEPA